MTPKHHAIKDQIPPEFTNEIKELLHGEQRIFSFLEFASILAKVVCEESYEQASLAIRSLSIEQALANLEQDLPSGLFSDPSCSYDRLIDLLVQSQLTLYKGLGKTLSNPQKMESKLTADAQLTVSILKGGELHNDFWLMLDRLFYQYWQPFRLRELDRMRLAEDTLSQAFSIEDITEATIRLPIQHPLRGEPELLSNAHQLGLKLFFWSEPLGLADFWFVTPKILGVSFGDPREILETLRMFAENITLRAAALSDPTRLIILRLIREFGKNNTEIASFLGISRPTVSNHAKILREAGLITSRIEGGGTIHQLQESELAALFAELKKFLAIT